MSPPESRPTRRPSFDFAMVVILSTINRLGVCNPFSGSGATTRRSSGASVGSVVKAQIVTDAVPLKRSSCTITTGHRFPAVSWPPDAVQISPRFTGVA